MIDRVARKLAAPVAELLGADADVERIAAAALETWQRIEAALAPIIGPLGFSSIYGRALKRSCAEHQWLCSIPPSSKDGPALAALHTALVQRSDAEAVAAHASLLQSFCEILSSLVGPALTERLLRNAWDPQSSNPSPEPSPS